MHETQYVSMQGQLVIRKAHGMLTSFIPWIKSSFTKKGGAVGHVLIGVKKVILLKRKMLWVR